MPSRPLLLTLVLTALLPAAAADAAPPRALYALSTLSAPPEVSAYAIGADGSLDAIGTTSLGTEKPLDLAFTPDGRHAYLALGSGSPGVRIMDVRPDGLLESGARVAAGSSAEAVAVSPDGRFLYLGDTGGAVRTYAIGADGGLTAVGSPSAGISDLGDLVVAPDGKHLYTTAVGGSQIATFTIGADGVPGARTAISTPGGYSSPIGLTITTAPLRLVVQDASESNDIAYPIGADGALGTPDLLPTGLYGGGPVAASPTGPFTFTTGEDSGGWSLTTWANGATLTQAQRVAYAAAPTYGGLAVGVDGRTLYVRERATGVPPATGLVRSFTVADDGSLSEVGSPVAAGATSYLNGGLVVAPEQPPVASFTAELFGDTVAVDASASTDEGSIERYDWDFGDGTVAADAGPITAHDYAGPGTYTITVTETDDLGCSTVRTYTGASVSCNGGAGARTTRTVTIPSPAGPGAPYVAPVTPAPAAPVAPSVAPVAPRVLPVLDGRGEGRVRATGSGRVTLPELTAVCPAGAGPCDDATVAVNAEIRGRAVTLGKGTFRVADGARAEVSLTLSKDGRRLLARARTLKVSGVVLLRNSASAAQAERVVTFTLLAPRMKR
jgi:6-phosphogluconolactonase (cycloisomerase 2 family)